MDDWNYLTNVLSKHIGVVEDIRNRLVEYCSSITDEKARDVMNERSKLILDTLKSLFSRSVTVFNRFCEYYEENGFNPYSLYVIALGAKTVNNKISYQKEWYDKEVYEYLDKLMEEVSVGEFTSLGSFFYTDNFNSMVKTLISPTSSSIYGTNHKKYVFPGYGVWGALKELYIMLQKDESLDYYSDELIIILKKDFAMFYRYLNNIDNEKLKSDVFLRFVRLVDKFYRNYHLSPFYFSSFVYAIFESDSFTEMLLKFQFLDDMLLIVSRSESPRFLLERISKIVSSDKFKEVCQGKLIKTDYCIYSNKKKKIIERMRNLYYMMNVDFSFESLNNNYNNASLISDLAFGKELLLDYEYAKFCSEYVNDIEKKRLFSNNILIYIKAIGMNKEFGDLFCQFYDKNKESIRVSDLYIIALSFQLQGNNCENFKAILDDLNDCIPHKFEFSYYDDETLLLFHLLGDSNYKNCPNLRMYFKNFLKEYSNNLNNLDKEVLSLVEELQKNRYGDRANEWDDNLFIRSEVLNGMLDYLLNDNKEFFYQDILGKARNRVSYINSKLHDIEDNSSIRKEIFSNICELSVELFSEVSLDDDKDLFIECMKIVFDSDTYSEMLSKFKVLRDASEEFKKDNKETALQMIKDLSSVSYKETLNEQIVAYPENCTNMVVKPNRMIDRMKYLYSIIDLSISYDFLDELHSNSDSIKKIETGINNHRNNPFCKIKKKFNRLNSKK